MKREKNNNLVNQNLIEMMEESTTNKNIQRAVNPCAKFFKHTEDANIVNNSSNLNNLNNLNNTNNHKASSHNLWALLSVAK